MEEVDILSARLAKPVVLNGTAAQSSKLSQIEAELDFYAALDWRHTSRIIVRELSRSDNRDFLHIKLGSDQSAYLTMKVGSSLSQRPERLCTSLDEPQQRLASFRAFNFGGEQGS